MRLDFLEKKRQKLLSDFFSWKQLVMIWVNFQWDSITLVSIETFFTLCIKSFLKHKISLKQAHFHYKKFYLSLFCHLNPSINGKVMYFLSCFINQSYIYYKARRACHRERCLVTALWSAADWLVLSNRLGT